MVKVSKGLRERGHPVWVQDNCPQTGEAASNPVVFRVSWKQQAQLFFFAILCLLQVVENQVSTSTTLTKVLKWTSPDCRYGYAENSPDCFFFIQESAANYWFAKKKKIYIHGISHERSQTLFQNAVPIGKLFSRYRGFPSAKQYKASNFLSGPICQFCDAYVSLLNDIPGKSQEQYWYGYRQYVKIICEQNKWIFLEEVSHVSES